MLPSKPKPPLTVQVDIPITRRLKMHAVVEATGEQIFHSRRISDVFTWILDNDIQEFTMLDGYAEFRVSLKPPLPSNPNQRG